MIISKTATALSVVTPQGMTLSTFWVWRDTMASAREFHTKASIERAAASPDLARYNRLAQISASHYARARRLNGADAS